MSDIKTESERVAMILMHGEEPQLVKVAGKMTPIRISGFTAKVAAEIERVATEAVESERKAIVEWATRASTDKWNGGDNTASIALDNLAEWVTERGKK